MSISHSWNGTVLTITSDAGTSSADLKGDTGCRGPQGPAGMIYDANGNVLIDLSEYATTDYVDSKITYGIADLIAGESALAPGVLYCVIEE